MDLKPWRDSTFTINSSGSYLSLPHHNPSKNRMEKMRAYTFGFVLNCKKLFFYIFHLLLQNFKVAMVTVGNRRLNHVITGYGLIPTVPHLRGETLMVSIGT